MDRTSMILSQLTSWSAIDNILNEDILHDIQCIDVMKMLYQEKAIVSYDTGLGKTYLMAAVIKMLHREDPERKFLVFVMKDQLIQTPEKLRRLTGLTVDLSTAAGESLENLKWRLEKGASSIVMLTHQCFLNREFMKWLWEKKSMFAGIFIDEAHNLNNINVAQSATILEGMCRQFRWCYALTATPIVSDVKQMARLAHVVDAKRYPSVKKLAYNLENGIFRIEEDPLFFINRTRADLGIDSKYVGHVAWVEAMPHQTEIVGGNDLMKLCKGDGAERQAEALVNLVKGYSGKRGLVYVNQHAVREWILPFLEKAGVKYACINGYTKQEERAKIMNQFNEEQSLDVVVTSVTTAIDLDCDYVVFYEFTVLLKQMIGRADRGLEGKTLDIWYVITRGSGEPEYFMENIVKRSQLTEQILQKDISEIRSVADSLECEVN